MIEPLKIPRTKNYAMLAYSILGHERTIDTQSMQNSKLNQAVARTSKRPSVVPSVVTDPLIGSSIRSLLRGE